MDFVNSSSKLKNKVANTLLPYSIKKDYISDYWKSSGFKYTAFEITNDTLTCTRPPS